MVEAVKKVADGSRSRRRGSALPAAAGGADYQPHVRVQHVPSKGRSSRVPHDGRMAHLLSDLETRLLLELKWSQDASDIREQVALPVERTLAIAKAMGVQHPIDPKSGGTFVMSTDIVAIVNSSAGPVVCARSVKPSSDLDQRACATRAAVRRVQRSLEKLELERRYWEEEGADWRLVCEHDLDRTRTANIQLLLSKRPLDPSFGPTYWQEALDLAARTLLSGSDRRLEELGQRLERTGKLALAHFMDCIRHLCANRALSFDMRQHFSPDLRACDFQASGV